MLQNDIFDRICVVNISSYNVSNINLYAVDNVCRMIGAVKKIVMVVLTLHASHVTLQIIEPKSFDT